MMKFTTLVGVVGFAGLVAGCAQQEEPTMVAPQPVFDKYGEGSCEEGYIYVPGAQQIPRCVPEDECDPQYNSAGAVIDCRPPRQRRHDDDDDNGGRNPQSPTGAAAPLN